MAHERNAQIFCISVLAFMLIQWLVFYVYANINNFLLAFQRFDANSGQQVFLAGNHLFDNFVRFFRELFSKNVSGYFFNGAIMHLTGLACLPLSIMFAFVIYKKLPCGGIFKVLLYLPTIMSAMVIALLFRYFIEYGAEGIYVKLFHGLKEDYPRFITDSRYAFGTMLLYSFFTGLPGSLLLNLGTMSRIPDELIEVGKLEGFSLWQEFYHLTIPMMFPILQIYCLGIFVGFFNAQGPLFAIYGNKLGSAPDETVTFGYYMALQVIGDSGGGTGDNRFNYGFTTAANLSIGLISIPIIWGTKKLFDKFDPEAEL